MELSWQPTAYTPKKLASFAMHGDFFFRSPSIGYARLRTLSTAQRTPHHAPKLAHHGMLSWSSSWQVLAGNYAAAVLPTDFGLRSRLWAEVRRSIRGKSGGEESPV